MKKQVIFALSGHDCLVIRSNMDMCGRDVAISIVFFGLYSSFYRIRGLFYM